MKSNKLLLLSLLCISVCGCTDTISNEQLAEIKGEKGDAGQDGVTPKLQINSTTGMWEVSYDNGATFASLGVKATGVDGANGTNGKDGISPKLQINSDNIWEISYDNGTTWNSLGINASGYAGEKGNTPKLQVNSLSNMWEVSYDDGTTWTSLKVHATGTNGYTPRIQVNTNDNMWEVSYDEGSTWISLGVQATGNTGSNGTNGTDGTNGKDGITPKLQVNSETNKWEVSYDDGKTWTSLNYKASGDTYVPVIFKDYDGTILNIQYCIQGGSVIYSGKDPLRDQIVNGNNITNYAFAGWDRNLTNINYPTTVYAKYTESHFTGHKVTFTDTDDSILFERYYQDGKKAIYPFEAPYSYDANNVYIFKGWSESLASISADITVKAETIAIPRTKNGEYPQTLVTDSYTIGELNKITATDEKGYKTYKNEKYYQYSGVSYLDGRGNTIEAGNQYYKVEPIHWRVLNATENNMLLISEYVIDNQQYNTWNDGTKEATDYKGNTDTVYGANYQYCNARTWLNTTFFNTAFTDNTLVEDTTVDNSKAANSNREHVEWTCATTVDKVFIPGLTDIYSETYFGYSYNGKKAFATDFAKANGLRNNRTDAYVLRSPYNNGATYTISYTGTEYVNYHVCYKHGMRPCITMTIPTTE